VQYVLLCNMHYKRSEYAMLPIALKLKLKE